MTTVIEREEFPMETEISKSKFKTHALEIFRSVETTGEPVIVTDHGTPTLIVRKYADTARNGLDKLKGSVLVYHSPLDPVDDEAWEAQA